MVSFEILVGIFLIVIILIVLRGTRTQRNHFDDFNHEYLKIKAKTGYRDMPPCNPPKKPPE